MNEIQIKSSIDGSIEPSLLFFPKGRKNVPLVVGLHTWSADRFNQQNKYLSFCLERGWALLLPEFRGPNLSTNPRAEMACGSQVARQDIIDAVGHVCAGYSIDSTNIFLTGGSGGGHMSLMTAAHKPEVWRAVIAWCPITDVALWQKYYGDGNGYAPHIEACCGGVPGVSPAVDAQYALRSPMSYLSPLLKVKALSIHHGRYDKSVPYVHSLNLATALEKLGHNTLYFEIFDGAHEDNNPYTFAWFDKLYGKSPAEAELTG